MSTSARFAVTAKIRAKFGNFFNMQDYYKLAQCDSLPEIASFLRDNPLYKDTLQDVHEGILHRGNLEILLRKAMYENLASLCCFDSAVGSDLHKHVIYYVEIAVLLTFFRYYNAQRSENIFFAIPDYFRERSKINFLNLVAAENTEALLAQIKDQTLYSLVKMHLPAANAQSGGPDINFTLLEATVYKRLYLTLFEALKVYDKKTQIQLSGLFGTAADVRNLKSIWRSKHLYEMDDADIKKIIIPYGNIFTQKQLDALCRSTSSEFDSVVSRKLYGRNAKETELPFDLALNRILYKKCRKLLHFSNLAPVNLASFVILMRIQHENITSVIESVRYSLPLEQRTRFLTVV